MPRHIREEQFESDIVTSLIEHGGYRVTSGKTFDPTVGLDTGELFEFIEATQPHAWDQLVTRHGGNAVRARQKFLSRLVDELRRRGTVRCLRGWIEDQGVKIRLAYFRPENRLNPDLDALYDANRLTVVRQVHFAGAGDSIDLVLFVNGIPIATAELKSPANGQTVDDAIEQYKTTRDSARSLLLRHAVVHFAVDPHLVYMTTDLAGDETEFLPFNQGSAPGRLSCGKGNPPNPGGYATSYLWERVWAYDTWLDILGHFVQSATTDGVGAGKPIFPRFHQWDAVTRLVDATRSEGPGRSYLVQHSAGSGKSNSIAWLTHRLSILHRVDNSKVFDKVIVVTDRNVLDEQLRATVQQFEAVPGTVISIDGRGGSKSKLLAEALEGKAQIITVTIETFPFVLDKISQPELAKASYAVVIDEAHSSQTGDAADALKNALGAGNLDFDAEDELTEIVRSRGLQPNLSFFAFTATPKDRTIELFGRPDPSTGEKGPFHLYTMRQAIEERFILDVLANYTTYSTYYRLACAADAKDEEVDVRRASHALRKVMSESPQVIAQKAAIVVEHFRAHTGRALGGQAKAMVVCESRPAAVSYKRAIDSYIKQRQYDDVRAVVAFTPFVDKTTRETIRESDLNGFRESETLRRFRSGAYPILIVAEKYQTGFDEPYLHTMFVDKPLKGLNAVQTLSRLNRTAPGKDAPFVIDFRNAVDDIQAGFQKYYEGLVIEPTNPNVLYDIRSRIMATGILDPDEIVAASDAYFGVDPSKRSLKNVYANVDPAVARFCGLDEDLQDGFRSALDSYTRAYSFLSQVMPFTDVDLERLFVYAKALAACLPTRSDGGVDLGKDVVLTHLRLEAAEPVNIPLSPGAPTTGRVFTGEGLGPQSSAPTDRLAAIIAEVNARFGAELDERDKLEIEKIRLTLLGDDELREVAEVNTLEDYALEFGTMFKGAVLDQEDRNRRLYELMTSQPEVTKLIEDTLMRETYRSLRDESDRNGDAEDSGGDPPDSADLHGAI